MTITLADVQAAGRTLAGAVLRTPMLPAPKLSALTGAEVFVKYENMQVTNSFKDRGAYVKLAALSAVERSRGVIAMSAGNHAQAVAYHSRRLGIPATIVMPVTTPFVKVKATEAYGAKVVLDGETLSECQERAATMACDQALVLVHPYDDPAIIAGQGTVALEMFEDVGDLDVLVVPIGGGGLIAGNAIAAHGLRPAVDIVGVEAALYPSMRNAITGANSPIGGPTLAEGIAVKNVGALTVPVVRELVSDIILVDEAHLERAVNAYLTLQKTMAEGAGAAGLAAMFAAPERFRNRKVGLVLCGGNIDPRILASIMVRELKSESTASCRSGSLSPIGPVCSARSRRCSEGSAPTFSKSITAGCFSTCRPKAPSSTSPWRPATTPTARISCSPSRRAAISRCTSPQAMRSISLRLDSSFAVARRPDQSLG